MKRIMRCCLLLVLDLGDVHSAIIEVTAGGGSEPTYMFSNNQGNEVATMTGNVTSGDITTSGDLRTAAGNSVDDLAARLAAADATINVLMANSVNDLAARLAAAEATINVLMASATFRWVLSQPNTNCANTCQSAYGSGATCNKQKMAELTNCAKIETAMMLAGHSCRSCEDGNPNYVRSYSGMPAVWQGTNLGTCTLWDSTVSYTSVDCNIVQYSDMRPLCYCNLS
jgi:hypothetical protein